MLFNFIKNIMICLIRVGIYVVWFESNKHMLEVFDIVFLVLSVHMLFFWK